MRVISRKPLREFGEKHPEAAQRLSDWFRVMERSTFRTPAELKYRFPSVSFVGDITIFNIGGNNYRISVNVRYEWGTVFVRRVMTHAEYDAGPL